MGIFSSKTNLQLADHVDLNRYMGKWYVIARTLNMLEKGNCNSSETYTMRPDGKIDVLYQANKKSVDGPPTTLPQTLWSVSPNNSRMKAKLFIWPLIFDYLVLDIDPDYQWVVAGTKSLLWIMARQTQMDPQLFNELVSRCKAKGYDVSKLERVTHKQVSK